MEGNTAKRIQSENDLYIGRYHINLRDSSFEFPKSLADVYHRRMEKSPTVRYSVFLDFAEDDTDFLGLYDYKASMASYAENEHKKHFDRDLIVPATGNLFLPAQMLEAIGIAQDSRISVVGNASVIEIWPYEKFTEFDRLYLKSGLESTEDQMRAAYGYNPKEHNLNHTSQR